MLSGSRSTGFPTRWSSSGHDKSIYGSEFAGRLDFNQYTEARIAPPCPTRWSSSGHDKGMQDNEFAGRLDFNQHTRLQDYIDEPPDNTRSDPLLKV